MAKEGTELQDKRHYIGGGRRGCRGIREALPVHAEMELGKPKLS